MMDNYRLSKYIELEYKTNEEYSFWGGYYNYDLLSADGTKLLCHRVKFDHRAITRDDRVEIGYIDIKSDKWHYIAESDSFNWQQGAMLQWLPCSDNKKVIFNCSKGNHLISKIVDITNGEATELCYPIYGLSPDGSKSITINLERSYWSYAYHYQSVVNEELNVDIDYNDGIFELDLINNSVKRIVSIEQILNLKPEPDFLDGKHWVEHIMINPEGTKFLFLHRYSYNGAGRKTRILSANMDGTGLCVVEDWNSYAWSHCGWRNNQDFAVYAVKRTKVAQSYENTAANNAENNRSIYKRIIHLIKPVYHAVSPLIPTKLKRRAVSQNGYQLYTYKDNEYVMVDAYNGRLMDIDGHPSFVENGKYMITDSYADEKKLRRLIIWNTSNHKGILVGRFFAPLWGTPAACDLHPKISGQGEKIVIDTACSGKHEMMVLSIDWDNVRRKIG